VQALENLQQNVKSSAVFCTFITQHSGLTLGCTESAQSLLPVVDLILSQRRHHGIQHVHTVADWLQALRMSATDARVSMGPEKPASAVSLTLPVQQKLMAQQASQRRHTLIDFSPYFLPDGPSYIV